MLKRNKNWLAIICGDTGSGKSFAALMIACLLSKRFNIDFVVFSAEEFMALVNSGRLKAGDIILFDEAGVGIPSREWWTISNKMINYVLQTFRHKNLGVIFTTPDFSFIDIQTRKLFHNYIETVTVNRKKNYCEVKWFELQHNPRFDKLYFKFPRIVENGEIKIVERVQINKPPEKLIAAYELKKMMFTKKLNIDAEKGIQRARQSTEKFFITPAQLREKAAEILANKERFTKFWHGQEIVDLDLVMTEFDVGSITARKIKKLAEKQLQLANLTKT